MTSLTSTEVRPTYMEVDLGALRHNFEMISKRVAPATVMCVVKANAYGHGLVRSALEFERAGATFFGVAFVEEGIELRRSGIKSPILIFGGIFNAQLKLFLDHDFDLTASSVSKLDAIEEVAKSTNRRARVHLKIDTGMGRVGMQYYSASALFERALKCTHCDIVGIFTHFSTSDEADKSFTKVQLERFKGAFEPYINSFKVRPLIHAANSGAVLQHSDSYFDMVRPGVALFGVLPSKTVRDTIGLKPSMSLKSAVVYFKVLKEGASVSYGRTWIAERQTRVVTVPIGYGDGFPRKLSNCGEVLIRGKRYPIIGRVCMDQLMVDLDINGEAYNGDEVVLIGEQEGEKITLQEVAERSDTIVYDILVALNLRVPRVYKVNGEYE